MEQNEIFWANEVIDKLDIIFICRFWKANNFIEDWHELNGWPNLNFVVMLLQ